MCKHANGYLTPIVGASQGVFRRNMWLVSNQRKECSTAPEGMLRTALARRVGSRFRSTGFRAFWATKTRGSHPEKSGAPRRDAANTDRLPAASELLQLDRSSGLLQLRL